MDGATDMKATTRRRVTAQAVAPNGATACAACGSVARRADARFCSTCGRNLGEDYFPTDSLRASYGFESRTPAPTASRHRAAPSQPPFHHQTHRRVRRTGGAVKSDFMPQQNRNGASTTALAFVTYALVPYLGILFCPGALLLGGIGLLRSYRSPHLGGRRASAMGIAFGMVVFGAQLLLWWILYKVPEWSQYGAMSSQ